MDKGGSLKDKIKRSNPANGIIPEIF